MVKVKTAKMPKKKVQGSNYVAKDEKYDRATTKKEQRGMKTAGLAVELKESEKDQGYSNMIRVKGQKKNAKPASGQKNIK